MAILRLKNNNEMKITIPNIYVGEYIEYLNSLSVKLYSDEYEDNLLSASEVSKLLDISKNNPIKLDFNKLKVESTIREIWYQSYLLILYTSVVLDSEIEYISD